jgi:orotidine-5'-phosphate decarboxylase
MSLKSVYVAIDTDNMHRAQLVAAQVSRAGAGLKIGLQFFCNHGKAGVESIIKACPQPPSVFLDLKFHDIPNTVAGAIGSLEGLKLDYINVHAAGGEAMMIAAKQAADALSYKPKLLAVTVLTSLDDEALTAVGQQIPAQQQVLTLAKLAKKCGLDGVVCSAHEIEAIRHSCSHDFSLMVPGIRPVGSDVGDQKRIMTPQEAMNKGANHLVIGRPITESADPFAATKAILESLSL